MYQLLVLNSEHTVCACFMPYVLPAFMCVVVCVHSGHTNTWRISACIYLSLWGSGGTHESILSQWQEVVFSVGLRWDFIWVSQTLPCQGAMLCPGVYLPPCCCFVSPGLKLKRLLLLLIIMQRDLGGGVVEAILHGKRMQTAEHLIFTPVCDSRASHSKNMGDNMLLQ